LVVYQSISGHCSNGGQCLDDVSLNIIQDRLQVVTLQLLMTFEKIAMQELV
jgi:hypothetical protein